MSIPGGLPNVPKRYPCMAVWERGTYEDASRVAHHGCEGEPKHLLRCDNEEDLEQFMQNVGEAVYARQETAIVYFLVPDADVEVEIVDTKEEADIKVTDKKTGECVWLRVHAWAPKNCYKCDPASDGKVDWTGHPENTVPREPRV